MNNYEELEPLERLENLGKFVSIAMDNIQQLSSSEFKVYLGIVMLSIGSGEQYTEQMSQKNISGKIGVSERTFNRVIQVLQDLKMIHKIRYTGDDSSGGSEPMLYGPAITEEMNIWIWNEEINE